MDIYEAMRARHSVRRYLAKPIEAEIVRELETEIERCNSEGGLRIQLLTEAPEAFQSILATYGLLRGVRNCIALVGRDEEDLDERVGYYGEQLVLRAQMLGLNSCWVGGTYDKKKIRAAIGEGERLALVIALGYGANQGSERKKKAAEQLCCAEGEVPAWFLAGVNAARLAPTAINQQKFRFRLLTDGSVRAEDLGGPYSKVDLGIVKYHFELGAGVENFRWAE